MNARFSILSRRGCPVSWERRPQATDGPYRIMRGRGSAHPEDIVEVFCRSQVLEKILRASRVHSPNECVGFLGGHRGADPFGRYVVVDECVTANKAQAQRAHVTLEIEQSLELRSLLEKTSPGGQYLGWFHSHPSLSTFFSSTDRETQRLASSDWYVGIVVDHADYSHPFRLFFGQDSQELQFVEEGIPATYPEHIASRQPLPARRDRSPRSGTPKPSAVSRDEPDMEETGSGSKCPNTRACLNIAIVAAMFLVFTIGLFQGPNTPGHYEPKTFCHMTFYRASDLAEAQRGLLQDSWTAVSDNKNGALGSENGFRSAALNSSLACRYLPPMAGNMRPGMHMANRTPTGLR